MCWWEETVRCKILWDVVLVNSNMLAFEERDMKLSLWHLRNRTIRPT